MDTENLKNLYNNFQLTLNKKSHDKGELYLFIVSIDDYKKETDLHHCRSEATDFISYFYQAKHVKKKNVYSFFDVHATKVNILAQMDEFKNILHEEDQLVIYFVGWGHDTSYANFFVPHDGSRDNFASCIPNSLIARALTELRSNSVLWCLDLQFTDQEYRSYAKKKKWDTLHELKNEVKKTPTQKESLHSKIIEFLSKQEKNRGKEAYCFVKEQARENTIAINAIDNQIRNDGLTKFIEKEYSRLLNDVAFQPIAKILLRCSRILENNDADLLGRVETLQTKLLEIEARPSADKTLEILEDKEAIGRITCEVIERIYQNGFYLIKTPSEVQQLQNTGKPKIKILFTSANPRDENYLRLDEEAKQIELNL